MPSIKTIQEVLNQLDGIIAESIANNSRLGLFAYVYRRTTAEIANEIALGNFEDNKRMEDFDVAFANLYLVAYENYKTQKPVSKSWAFAFDQAEHQLTIIQHILFGMNAHINLDLSIATAQTMKGKDIKIIENDFNKVNDILFQITNELQERLSRVSPLMFLLDLIGKNSDEKIIDFSMRKARDQAWNSANLLWSLGESDKEKVIKSIDGLVLKLNQLIKSPKSFLARTLLKFMKLFEKDDVKKIINKLKEV
jgi:hypothetical protein